jgi:hypothetical protein
VGVGNPAEETYCYPNTLNVCLLRRICQLRILENLRSTPPPRTTATLEARASLVRSGVAKLCAHA